MANVSPAEDRLNQAITLLSLTTVVSIFYTLVSILYCLSFRLFYAQLRDNRGKIKRQTVCTLVFQTVLVICATLDVIVQNRIAQVTYIDNVTLPGGSLGLSARLTVITFSRVRDIVNVVAALLIQSMLLWRVWVVWNGTRFFVPLTIALLFLYLGTAVLEPLAYAVQWNIGSLSLAATPRVQLTISMMSTVFSLTSYAFMTSMIIARLLYVRRKHIKLMGRSDVACQYLGVVAMLIECYAVDTVWLIGLFISFGLKYAPTYNLFTNGMTQVDILANFLVIYRVLSGRAWTRQTEDQLTSLRWASNGAGTTTFGIVDLRQTCVPEDRPPVTSFRRDSV